MTAANGLLQAFAAMQGKWPVITFGLIEAMQQQNVPPHPAAVRAAIALRARHYAGHALLTRHSQVVSRMTLARRSTCRRKLPAGRWLADVTASLRQVLTHTRSTPASFSRCSHAGATRWSLDSTAFRARRVMLLAWWTA